LSQSPKKTSIGGQALIEGVMMRGVSNTVMAVRGKDGEIILETVEEGRKKPWYSKVPLLRGCCNMVVSLMEGYKCLMRSAELSGFEEEEGEPSKFEKKITELLGDKLMPVLVGLGSVLGILLAVTLFIALPTFLTGLIGKIIPLSIGWKSVLEGIFKAVIFIGYLYGVSHMADIRRVFEYHGGEHKSIACYEAGDELTVENVRKHKRFHPRCGTSFLFLVIIVSIVVSSLIRVDTVLLRIAFKFLTLPLTVGISYELIKLSGRYDNFCTRIVSAPGMWLQRLTTAEPDDSQIEVALASLKAVLPREGEDDNL